MQCFGGPARSKSVATLARLILRLCELGESARDSSTFSIKRPIMIGWILPPKHWSATIACLGSTYVCERVRHSCSSLEQRAVKTQGNHALTSVIPRHKNGSETCIGVHRSATPQFTADHLNIADRKGMVLEYCNCEATAARDRQVVME